MESYLKTFQYHEPFNITIFAANMLGGCDFFFEINSGHFKTKQSKQ